MYLTSFKSKENTMTKGVVICPMAHQQSAELVNFVSLINLTVQMSNFYKGL